VASYDEVIPPGQAGKIAAKLDTVKLHGDVGRGITVRTDDPDRPSVFLTLRAHVTGGVWILPDEVLHVQNRGGLPAGASVVVRRDPEETDVLAIRDVTPSVPWLRASAENVTEPRQGSNGVPPTRPGDWVVHVEPGPDAPYGRARAEVTFVTGLSTQKEVTLPVMVYIDPPVRLSTERLELTPGPDGTPTPGTVLLTVRPGLDPAGLAVESRPGALHVELEPSGPRAFKLHVDWQGDGIPKGEIVFRVGTESYTLPVYSGAGSS